MNWRRASIGLLAAALLLPAAPQPARAQDGAAEYRGAAALGLSLRKLGTTKRVLMVGAHPDDEDTQLLARFALEEGADVAYLSLTRGEGGQNGIGPELGEGLGLLRTEELLAARRVDGAEQFFTRAYDFGFSKSAEEAYAHWPREELLRDVVRVVRLYRPDVIVTVFSGTPRDGHGQHQVSALLAHEAFTAAADPARFPEQLREGLRPWQPAKMYQSMRGNTENATVRIPIGDLDPLIGRSPFQLAMASRSRHRSQDMGRPELPGPRWGTLLRIQPAPGGPEASVWTGIDTTLAPAEAPESAAARGLAAYQRAAEGLRAQYNPLAPGALVRGLSSALNTLRQARAAIPVSNGTADLVLAIDREIAQAETALALASGLVLDALADDARIVPGQALELTLTLWNGGGEAVRVDSLRPRLPAGWRAEPASVPVRFGKPGEVREVRFAVTAPAGAAAGDHPVSAIFEAEGGGRFARGAQLIDYPHVRARPLYHAAQSVVRAFDVRVPRGLRVAYIEGAGEEGPGFLANLGITPELLDADDLAEGDLGRFDVIVAGSRVYEVRQDVMAHNQRLLDYVSRGGTLIVQYNKYEIVEGGFTPYPITMRRPHGRVTDENAPIRILDPAHPVFTAPNRITDADWQGWVQERGLYFAETWDDAYTPLLETGDPGEAPLCGGLLIAKHGQGTYIYTGIAFFRQFPEGVPGAYRLFANLLALGAK
ncbi:MAG TPA: PIG-L family deacetylase [Longimicrobium sp.]|nr:PIG-L family deacetylase [Longimicrobium sp.]